MFPALRRSTHLYCLSCGLSKQDYSQKKCDVCGYKKFGSMMKAMYCRGEIDDDRYFEYLKSMKEIKLQQPNHLHQT